MKKNATTDAPQNDIVLSETTIFKIDPMINMGEMTPYDFCRALTFVIKINKINLSSHKDE